MRIVRGGWSYPAVPSRPPAPTSAAPDATPPQGNETPSAYRSAVLSTVHPASLPADLKTPVRRALQAYLGVQGLPSHGVDVLGLDTQA